MNKHLIVLICFIGLVIASATAFAALDSFGDSRGRVAAVVVRPVQTGGAHIMRVYFSTIEHDRFGCLADAGWVEVTTDSAYVSVAQFQAILSMALSAQASGKTFAIDSATGSPCTTGTMAWVFTE